MPRIPTPPRPRRPFAPLALLAVTAVLAAGLVALPDPPTAQAAPPAPDCVNDPPDPPAAAPVTKITGGGSFSGATGRPSSVSFNVAGWPKSPTPGAPYVYLGTLKLTDPALSPKPVTAIVVPPDPVSRAEGRGATGRARGWLATGFFQLAPFVLEWRAFDRPTGDRVALRFVSGPRSYEIPEQPLTASTLAVTPEAPNAAPTAAFSVSSTAGADPLTVTFDASASADPDGALTDGDLTWDFGDASPEVTGRVVQHTYAGGEFVPQLTVRDVTSSAGTATTCRMASSIVVSHAFDPPPLPPGAAPTVAAQSEFLYTGSNPIQTGMPAGTIVAERASVIRGRVFTLADPADPDGSLVPVPNALVRVVGHTDGDPVDYGETTTRADGWWDLAVNGGGALAVDVAKDGYLAAQRTVEAGWGEFGIADDLVLLRADARTTAVQRGASTWQVHRGTEVGSDAEGRRQHTLLFPPGTTATLTFGDGRPDAPLPGPWHARVTEFTVGGAGPAAMPAELATYTAYTFAADYALLEADAAGAEHVVFDRPVISYHENYLQLPVGELIPYGTYEPRAGNWVPQPNGRIVEVVSTSGGIAALDTDGDGDSDSADLARFATDGGTDGERRELAALYEPGEQLWRIPHDHFSRGAATARQAEPVPPADPGDGNYGIAPGGPPCTDFGCKIWTQLQRMLDPCWWMGSIAECETGVLREQVGGLTYRSLDRPWTSDSGYYPHPDATVHAQLTGEELPPDLRRIHLVAYVGGTTLSKVVDAAPNLVEEIPATEVNAYGQELSCEIRVHVKIGYEYPARYLAAEQADAAFASTSAQVSVIGGTRTTIVWAEFDETVGACDARDQGTGGWQLPYQHGYNPETGTLHLGDGRVLEAADLNWTFSHWAGTGIYGSYGRPTAGPATSVEIGDPRGVALAPDGTAYVASEAAVWRITRDGYAEHIAGGLPPYGQCGCSGDPARWVPMNPMDVAVERDGTVVVSDSYYNHSKVWRLRPSGGTGSAWYADLVAGGGTPPDGVGDGLPARQAQLAYVEGIAVGPDGSIVIADTAHNRIRRIGVDGIIRTIAGTGAHGTPVVPNPALQQRVGTVKGVAVGPDGSVYFADSSNRVYRVDPSGMLFAFAGVGGPGSYGGDGGPAAQAIFNGPHGVDVGPDGSVLIADVNNHRIRAVDVRGYVRTVAGTGQAGDTLGGSPTASALRLPRGATLGDDGAIYVADSGNHKLKRLAPSLPSFTGADLIVPSPDGSELYHFDRTGLHLATYDALTGAALRTFEYGNDRRVDRVTDGDGNETRITRDIDTITITDPWGHTTRIELFGDGWARRIVEPGGVTHDFEYYPGGLLRSYTDPNGSTSTFTYDLLGRLASDRAEDGYALELDHRGVPGDRNVTLRTAEDREHVYGVTVTPDGTAHRIHLLPDGSGVTSTHSESGFLDVRVPDGTRLTQQDGPDPRFGSQVPLAQTRTIALPSGQTYTTHETATAVIGGPDGPLGTAARTSTVSGPRGPVTTRWTGATRTVTVTDPAGRVGTAVLDDQGRPLSIRVPGQVPVDIAYLPDGRLAAVTEAAGTWTYEYSRGGSANGYVEWERGPLDHDLHYGYDGAGRITTVEEWLDGALVATSRWRYDDAGNVTGFTPPGGAETAYRVTAGDQVKQVTPPPGRQPTLYRYTDDRELDLVTRADGSTVDYRYDQDAPGSGHLTSIVGSDGATRSFTYDRGLVATATTPDASIAVRYDGALLRSVTSTGVAPGSVEYVTNLAADRVTELVSGSGLTFTSGPGGALDGAGPMAISSDPTSQFETGTQVGRVATVRTPDAQGRTDAVETRVDGVVFSLLDYEYDALGRVERVTETLDAATTVWSYGYDTRSRLTEVRRDGSLVASYSYDARGNPLGATVNDNDELLALGTLTATYTPNGELATLTDATTGATTTFTYDDLGQLRRVEQPGGHVVEYRYDAFGDRIARLYDGAVEARFVYDSLGRVVATVDASGTVRQRYVYATKQQSPDLVVEASGRVLRVVSDRLGSPRAVIDTASGAVVARYDDDAYGARTVVAQETGFSLPFGFTGMELDPRTGMLHRGPRDYSPTLRRWTTPDPIGFAGGTNLYEYALGSPTNHFDPDGAMPKDEDVDALKKLAELIKKDLRSRGGLPPHPSDMDRARDAYNRARMFEPRPPTPPAAPRPGGQMIPKPGGHMVPYESPPLRPGWGSKAMAEVGRPTAAAADAAMATATAAIAVEVAFLGFWVAGVIWDLGMEVACLESRL